MESKKKLKSKPTKPKPKKTQPKPSTTIKFKGKRTERDIIQEEKIKRFKERENKARKSPFGRASNKAPPPVKY